MAKLPKTYTQATAPMGFKTHAAWKDHKALKYVGKGGEALSEIFGRNGHAAVIGGEVFEWIPKAEGSRRGKA